MAKARQKSDPSDETALRAKRVTGIRSVEFPNGDGEVRFVSDEE